MNSKMVLIGTVLEIFVMSGLPSQIFATEKVGMANPASVYCAQSGYKSEPRTKLKGNQYRACVFPDGRECEEWAFFRSECGAEYGKISEPGQDTSCITDEECACGTHINTGQCFYGNKLYVNAEKQCPDFCSGFAGNLTMRCLNRECRQVPAKE